MQTAQVNPPAAAPVVADGDFRVVYTEGLWATMYLGFCKPESSIEASALMARWWSLTEQANRLGLAAEIEAARQDKAERMALMRIDVTCRNGVAAAIDRTTPVLDKLEAVLGAREEAA